MINLWKRLKQSGPRAIPILKLRNSLLTEATLSQNYLVLTMCSCLIATFGLLVDSTAVIIGAMVIAPLMLPLRGFSFATLEGDTELLRKSSVTLVVSTVLAIACSWLIGWLINLPEFGSEVLSRSSPTLIDLLIAIIAGIVGGYARIRPEVGDTIPGVAISVALMPPLCVIGLALSQGNGEIALGATLLYGTNLIGINLSCMGVYGLEDYSKGNELTRSLSWGISLILIAILIIPLGIQFWRLTNQVRAQDSINRLLANGQFTDRQDIQIIRTTVYWQRKPPTIYLVVRANQPITANDVTAAEQFLRDQVKQEFKLIFDVTRSEIIESTPNQ